METKLKEAQEALACNDQLLSERDAKFEVVNENLKDVQVTRYRMGVGFILQYIRESVEGYTKFLPPDHPDWLADLEKGDDDEDDDEEEDGNGDKAPEGANKALGAN